MLHAFVPNPIGNSGYFDIEPWFGYAGPTLKDPSPGFADKSLRAYSNLCREHSIVAEIVRFHPLHRNQLAFSKAPGIELTEGRKIAFVPIVDGEDAEQLAVYSRSCRKQVRAARKSFFFGRLSDTPEDWEEFVILYHHSLRRLRAARRWYFDPSFFERMRRAKEVSLWGVFAEGTEGRRLLVSAALVMVGKEIAYSLLRANRDLHSYKGANELLTHELVRALRIDGYRWLCLGGGRSASEEHDSLLAFKAKFSSNNLIPLPLGFICHDPEAVARLKSVAAKEHSLAQAMQPSTELLKRFMSYRLAPSLSNAEAISQ
jgi:hypothetical protein